MTEQFLDTDNIDESLSEVKSISLQQINNILEYLEISNNDFDYKTWEMPDEVATFPDDIKKYYVMIAHLCQYCRIADEKIG